MPTIRQRLTAVKASLDSARADLSSVLTDSALAGLVHQEPGDTFVYTLGGEVELALRKLDHLNRTILRTMDSLPKRRRSG